MRNVTVNRTMPASRQAVWDVLADFPNISTWNTGVKHSESTSDAVQGVGAKRHCDLSPMGELEETISTWDERELLVIDIDSAKKMPIKRGQASFALSGPDDATSVELSYDYETKLSFLEPIIGGMMDGQLTKGFTGFLDDLEKAATAAPAQ